jgi:hypothetical protein
MDELTVYDPHSEVLIVLRDESDQLPGQFSITIESEAGEESWSVFLNEADAQALANRINLMTAGVSLWVARDHT